MDSVTLLESTSVKLLGLALKRVSSDQFHIGVVYRTGVELRMMHLAWHHDFRDEQARADYMALEVLIDDINARVLAAFCVALAKENRDGRIPYGFYSSMSSIDAQSGKYLPEKVGHGFTCATFAMRPFEIFQLPLIDCKTWPARASDRHWQQSIVDSLMGVADASHIEALRNDIGSARFRPEEVGGSAQLEPKPATFSQVESVALAIREIMG